MPISDVKHKILIADVASPNRKLATRVSDLPRYRIYALKKKVFLSMKARFGEGFRCSQCEREFKMYDIVMSKPSRRGSKVKWYHLSCYEALLLE